MACMSFPDGNPPPPPSPLLPLPSSGKDIGDFWTRFPTKPDHADTRSKHEDVPFLKSLTSSANKPPNFGPLSPRNLLMNRSDFQEGKGASLLFYKTRVCKRFMAGTCPNGELCTYAHGVQDLREPAPNWKQLMHEMSRSSGNSNDHHKVIQRTKICKRYYIGEECPYGEKCIFLHERPMKFETDMATERESSAISIATTGLIVGSRSDNEQLENKDVNTKSEVSQIKPVLWKTKICRTWATSDECAFREGCHFAHGESDLQVPGGHIEAEPVVQAAPVQIRPLSICRLDSRPANATVGEDAKIPKWKLTKKISGIYADWLDGFVPPYEAPDA